MEKLIIIISFVNKKENVNIIVKTSLYNEQDCVINLNKVETLTVKVSLIYSLNFKNVILINNNIILKAYTHIFNGITNIITIM
jgi:hypothetical protein